MRWRLLSIQRDDTQSRLEISVRNAADRLPDTKFRPIRWNVVLAIVSLKEFEIDGSNIARGDI